MRIKNIHKIEGRIKLITGLHIGGNKDNIEIGGMEQPVIRQPVLKNSDISGQPYIPGSSLKGKMRSMLEMAFFAKNISADDGKPCGCGKCEVCMIFGAASVERPEELGPTRIVVRDSLLTKEWKDRFNKGNLPLEEKYEVAINRVQGTALHGSLRPVERVPAEVKFDFHISLKQMEEDPDDMINWIWKSLRLIELDGLGGNISRGSGQVEFKGIKHNDVEKPDVLNEAEREIREQWEKIL